VRLISRLPIRSSSLASRRLIVDFGRPSARARLGEARRASKLSEDEKIVDVLPLSRFLSDPSFQF